MFFQKQLRLQFANTIIHGGTNRDNSKFIFHKLFKLSSLYFIMKTFLIILDGAGDRACPDLRR